MKQVVLFLLSLGMMSLFAPQVQASGVSSTAPTSMTVNEAPEELSRKELRQQRRMERRMERRMKWAQRVQRLAPEVEGNLRYALLGLIAAVVLSVVAVILAFVPGVGGLLSTVVSWLAYAAWLAAVVFFVLWLVDEIA